MFLSEDAQRLINELRDNSVNYDKASISDAMSIIMFMYQNHASEKEQQMLVDAMNTLSSYNELLTELSKEE